MAEETEKMSCNDRGVPTEGSSTIQDHVQKGFAPASEYEKVRQSYPENAVRFFLQNLQLMDVTTHAPQKKVLELGAGTGKFTRVMLDVLKDQNVEVAASDPLKEMCEEFKQHQPGIEIIQCDAESISLPDASVDVVIACQCFHWFANSTSLEEIYRVLVPNGIFGIIWALFDPSLPWTAKIWDFFVPLLKEKSVILPFDEKWKDVFSSTSRRLFSDLEGNQDFSLASPSNFDEAYNFFKSSSVVVNASEGTKKLFQQLFNKIMREEFQDKGIAVDHIPFQIFMNWCQKIG